MDSKSLWLVSPGDSYRHCESHASPLPFSFLIWICSEAAELASDAGSSAELLDGAALGAPCPLLELELWTSSPCREVLRYHLDWSYQTNFQSSQVNLG